MTQTDKQKPTWNFSRFFVENRQITWVLLIMVFIWGVYGYIHMPKRKDPETPVHIAVAVTVWPGASAEKVEQLVTRKIEEKVMQNSKVERVDSVSRNSISIVYIRLIEKINEPGKDFDDIKIKLDSIKDLPDGCQPIMFNKDFGDTAALMLTVASPKADPTEIKLRTTSLKNAIQRLRAGIPASLSNSRMTWAACLPRTLDPRSPNRLIQNFSTFLKSKGHNVDIRSVQGPGFVAIDSQFTGTDEEARALIVEFISDRLRATEIPPDAWGGICFRDPNEISQKLTEASGDKYTYQELDRYTDLIRRTIQGIPLVSKVERAGLLPETVYLDYSQERLASYGIQPAQLKDLLNARNITFPGGTLEVDGKNLSINPSGEFTNYREIGNVMISASSTGSPVYLRDLVEISRDYQKPSRYLNYYTWKDAHGQWQRSRAITLSVQMKQGEQIGDFGKRVDKALNELQKQLPDDLVISRTSDQPLQTEETVDLFMQALYEAVILVVLVAFIGFWEWRAAVLMSLSIPLTLAMTFGMMSLLGLDIQFVSIGSMIIALGLLVDVPVVSGDAVKREMENGVDHFTASWLGPTKLAKAILFATLTNIVAYLPMLLLSGNVGRFLYSLPVVLACSLVASYIVAMMFIPFLSNYLLVPPKKHHPPMAIRRTQGFSGWYSKVGMYSIKHRWMVLGFSMIFLIIGSLFFVQLKPQFFAKDLSYLSYVDVWLPADAPMEKTNLISREAENIIREVCDKYSQTHPGKDGKPRQVLRSLTTFVGGGGPRFWFSVEPEIQQLNYAQIILQVKDKHDTNLLVTPLQEALQSRVPGARVDVRQLETGKPVGRPVSIRIHGSDIQTLRNYAEQVKTVLRSTPLAQRVRDDWDQESFAVDLQVDPDRANMVGITNLDVALSSAAGMSGIPVTVLREGDKQIPVVVRLRMEERAQLSDIKNLYVYSVISPQKVQLREISDIKYNMELSNIHRRNQFRTITVSCFPSSGVLASEVMKEIKPKRDKFASKLPPGYGLEYGGEYEEQVKGFAELAIVMMVSILLIYLALVLQFKNAIKPFIVFAAIPFGMMGAVIALWIMGSPFGFMAFLGCASLIGIIVSHVIVLFDFIEEKHDEGECLPLALVDAGIIRLRPVMITVLALVLALFPLALHGGPLWEPLCYAQIGGLTVATFITLLLVPTFYAICVLDLKIIKWKGPLSVPQPDPVVDTPVKEQIIQEEETKPAASAPEDEPPTKE